jgi:hypothetical protein
MSSLKTVYTAASETEAEIIRSLLLNAGIESQISSDDGGGMLQSLSYADGVAVVVDEASFGDAMAVLEEYRKGETAISEDEGQ